MWRHRPPGLTSPWPPPLAHAAPASLGSGLQGWSALLKAAGTPLPRGLCTGCSWVSHLSPLHAFTSLGSLVNATFQGAPRLPPHGIPHPSAFAAATRRVTLRIPSVSLCHLLPTSVPRLCGRTGHLAASLDTLPECQHAHQTTGPGAGLLRCATPSEARQTQSGASDVRHPQCTARLPHT